MDLTARFGADFADFHEGVASATAALVDFEKGSNRVQSTLDRMTDSFSGRAVIQQADVMTKAIDDLGGAAKLTDAELARVSSTVGEAVAKMDRLGMSVPDRMRELAAETKGAGQQVGFLNTAMGQMASMIAGAFTVQSILNFAAATADAAQEIKKTAIQTGLLADEVQQFQYIASQSGVNFDSFVSGLQTLEQNLGSGDKGVIKGLQDLGINIEAFKQLSAADQVYAVSDALKGFTSQTDYAAAAAAVFGKNWKEVTPMLLSDMKQLGAEAPRMSEAAIAGLTRLGDEWSKLKTIAMASAGNIVGAITTVTDSVDKWMDHMTTLPDVWNYVMGNAGSIDAAKNARIAAFEALHPPIVAVAAAASQAGDAFATMGTKGDDLAKKMRDAFDARHAQAIKDQAEAAKKAAAEMDDWSKTFAEVDAAGTNWRTTLADIDHQLVEHIQLKLEAGVASEKLAKAYGLTDQQLKAIATDLKLTNETLAEGKRLATDLEALKAQNEGSDLEARIAAIDRWAAHEKQTLEENATWTIDLQNQIDAIRHEKIVKATVDFDALAKASQSGLRDTATTAQATYEFMLAHSEKYASEAIIHQQDVAQAASIAADQWEQSFTAAGEAVSQAGEAAAARQKAAAQSVAMSWSQAMDAVRAGQGTMSGSTSAFSASANEVRDAFQAHRYYGPVKMGIGGLQPDYEALGLSEPGAASGWSAGASPWAQRAGGGPVTASSPYIVGEQGPELFVPDRSGTIVPNGTGSGVVANIYVNGTGADVARVINAELTRLMRVGRKWPSV